MNPIPIDRYTFEICITGPSYPAPDCKIFTYPDDLIKEWCNLIPGTYIISETDPGDDWIDVEIVGSPANVPSGDYAYATVTNKIIPGGCTYTPGYWKTHSIYGPAGPPDPTWNDIPDFDGSGAPGGIGPDELFFDSTETWLSIMSMKTNAKTKTYQQLAFHYVAAYLNGLNNGFLPSEISTLLSDAETILDAYGDNFKIPKKSAEETTAKQITSILGEFNEGCYDLNWPHCDDIGTLRVYKADGTTYDLGTDSYDYMGGWEFELYSQNCEKTKTLTTAGEGFFEIELMAGNYDITELIPTGFEEWYIYKIIIEVGTQTTIIDGAAIISNQLEDLTISTDTITTVTFVNWDHYQ